MFKNITIIIDCFTSFPTKRKNGKILEIKSEQKVLTYIGHNV